MPNRCSHCVDTLSLLDDTRDRLVRMETLVTMHLEKGGTVDSLESKLDGMNTRVLLFSGAVSGLVPMLRFLAGFITK
jgi:hypothetical protein